MSHNWQAGDAHRLARFFNKQGHGWPSGRWDPQTPEESERRLRERDHLGVFVTEERGEFLSFCSLDAKPNDTKVAYVPLLAVDPDYHGHGYGKAVLHQALDSVYQRGIARVDLHTWAGNMKAIPLYKKSGFMWSPESSHGRVYMQNFIPGARRNPVAQEFFRSHDWYTTLKRHLSLFPDEHKRGKVRVYEYIWEEDGNHLRMVFDRQSCGLLEVETNDFLAGCSLPDESLVAGVPQRISWHIHNRRREPLAVALIANADEGILLDRHELLTVTGRAELDAEFLVDPDIRENEKDSRSQVIRTDVLLNGRLIRLEAGFTIKQPVSFSLDGDGQGLRPGHVEPVVIECRSELESQVRVKLHIAASPGVELNRSNASLYLPAKGSAKVPVQLTASNAGPISLSVRSEVNAGKRIVQPKPAELHAHVLAAGDVVGHIEMDRVVLESTALRVNIWRRGGRIEITDKLRNRRDAAGIGHPQVGPPFARDEFFETPCEARIDQKADRAVAVLSSVSIYRPGITLEERVTVSNLPLVEVRCSVVNNSASRLAASVRQVPWFNLMDGRVSAVVGGYVVEGTGGAARHLFEHRLSDKGEDWVEGWLAAHHNDGMTAAVLWDKAEMVDRGEITQKLAAAAPGESASAGPMYVFVGEGGAFAVRRWWQMLFGQREQRPLQKRRPFEFGLRPRPLVIHGRETTASLAIDSVGRLEFDGNLSIELPNGLRASPGCIQFKGANESKKIHSRIAVTRAASVRDGAYFAECTVRLDRAIYRDRQPLIVLGDSRKEVTVNKIVGDNADRFRIANGMLAMTVAPGFMGSAVSLERGGEQLLRSAYPEARPLVFMNPWIGGIQPGFGRMSAAALFKQKFRAREITRRGSQGMTWRGVRVACLPKQDQRNDNTLAIDYLFAPGSSVFAVCVRVGHCADIAGWVEASFQLYPVIGGSHCDAIIRGSADEHVSRICCEHGGFLPHNLWVTAENPKTNEAVVLARSDTETVVGASVWGRDGFCLEAWRGATHEARETRESVFFVAWTGAEQARELGETLAELKGLP